MVEIMEKVIVVIRMMGIIVFPHVQSTCQSCSRGCAPIECLGKRSRASQVIAERGESQTRLLGTPSFSINSDVSIHISYRPEVTVQLFDTSSQALLDLGTSISSVSEEFFSKLQKLAPTPKSMPVLPVTGVTISQPLCKVEVEKSLVKSSYRSNCMYSIAIIKHNTKRNR